MWGELSAKFENPKYSRRADSPLVVSPHNFSSSAERTAAGDVHRFSSRWVENSVFPAHTGGSHALENFDLFDDELCSSSSRTRTRTFCNFR